VEIAILRPVPVPNAIRESLLVAQNGSEPATLWVVSLATGLLCSNPPAHVVRHTCTKREFVFVLEIIRYRTRLVREYVECLIG
jgi:hypothetical protein